MSLLDQGSWSLAHSLKQQQQATTNKCSITILRHSTVTVAETSAIATITWHNNEQNTKLDSLTSAAQRTSAVWPNKLLSSVRHYRCDPAQSASHLTPPMCLMHTWTSTASRPFKAVKACFAARRKYALLTKCTKRHHHRSLQAQLLLMSTPAYAGEALSLQKQVATQSRYRKLCPQVLQAS